MSFSVSSKGSAKEVEHEVRDNSVVPHSVKAFLSEAIAHDSTHAHGATDVVEFTASGHITNEDDDGESYINISFKTSKAPVKKKAKNGAKVEEAPSAE